MKLTVKHVMFILMSVLLVLTVVMALLTVGRVGDFLQLGGKPNLGAPQNNSPDSPNIAPSGSTPSSQTIIIEPGHEHEYVKEDTFSPSCVSSGYTLYECSCGKQDIQDFKDPLGHNYGEYSVVSATCTTDGWTERTCSRCKNVEKTNLVSASHSFENWANVETADGTSTLEQRTCLDCDITEIRSLDSANTWVIRLTELESENGFAHYRVVVDLADNKNDPAYDVYSELADSLQFDYSSNGLCIYYNAGGMDLSYSMPAGAAVVTFYADGNVTTAEPVITPEPDTPDPENPNPDAGGEGTGDGETGSDPAGTETE